MGLLEFFYAPRAPERSLVRSHCRQTRDARNSISGLDGPLSGPSLIGARAGFTPAYPLSSIDQMATVRWVASLQPNDPVLVAIERLRTGMPATPPSCGRALQIKEAASLSGRSRMTIYRAIAAGVLVAAPLYPGGRRCILESDLQAWLSRKGCTV